MTAALGVPAEPDVFFMGVGGKGYQIVDLSSPIAAAGAGVLDDFTGNLGAVIVIVLPVLFALFVWRKVRGQIR